MATVHWTMWPGSGQERFDLEHLRRVTSEAAEAGGMPAWQPVADVLETPDRFVVIMELPGVDVADINVEIREDALCVVGRRTPGPGAADGGFTLVERHHGGFARVFRLGKGLNFDNVSAKLDQGLLEISIPKSTVHGSRRRIQVS